ncbi:MULTISPECIES: hypothetical protein [Micromonospora]|uniref:hypothetical protein n=1 Tax=Micromonospora TaxID=1873 RepID=UPI001E4D7A9F|nr:hypothetical protein [Micromonospora sp. NBRC 110038]
MRADGNLINDSALPRGRRRDDGGSADFLPAPPGGRSVLGDVIGPLEMRMVGPEVVYRAIAGSRHELLLALPVEWKRTGPALDVIAGCRLARAGIRVKAYVSAECRVGETTIDGAVRRLIRSGASVFTTSESLPRLSVVDGRLLMSALNQRGYDSGGLAGRELPFLGLMLRSMHAHALALPAEFPGDESTESLSREVLHQLVSGFKDEAAARRVGMSLRTYRRSVARWMTRLGAQSRFQAGYEAAVQGLLFSRTRRDGGPNEGAAVPGEFAG